MIQQVLNLIIKQLNKYFVLVNTATPGTILQVVAGNIALSSVVNGGTANYMNNNIVVTIVNLMEEGTLKNSSAYRLPPLNSEIENPPVFINAYLLFSANFSPELAPGNGDSTNNYFNGVTGLSRVIEFFQGKNYFTFKNSPFEVTNQDPLVIDSTAVDLLELSLKMELVSLTFEQVNHLWGSLGGKQMPFVLYKAHVIPVKRTNIQGRGSLIQDIQTTSLHLYNVES
jgi:hypothetical protein